MVSKKEETEEQPTSPRLNVGKVDYTIWESSQSELCFFCIDFDYVYDCDFEERRPMVVDMEDWWAFPTSDEWALSLLHMDVYNTVLEVMVADKPRDGRVLMVIFSTTNHDGINLYLFFLLEVSIELLYTTWCPYIVPGVFPLFSPCSILSLMTTRYENSDDTFLIIFS